MCEKTVNFYMSYILCKVFSNIEKFCSRSRPMTNIRLSEFFTRNIMHSLKGAAEGAIVCCQTFLTKAVLFKWVLNVNCSKTLHFRPFGCMHQSQSYFPKFFGFLLFFGRDLMTSWLVILFKDFLGRVARMESLIVSGCTSAFFCFSVYVYKTTTWQAARPGKLMGCI